MAKKPPTVIRRSRRCRAFRGETYDARLRSAAGVAYSSAAGSSRLGASSSARLPRRRQGPRAPLIDKRTQEAGRLFKILDYKTGEQTRDWYRRHELKPGSMDPEVVPYYLLLVGPPDEIPFEFQYLLGVDYTVGRLSFATPAEYTYTRVDRRSQLGGRHPAHEVNCVLWHASCRRRRDPAQLLAAHQPAGGAARQSAGRFERPLNKDPSFDQQLFFAEDATKDALIGTFGGGRPPAIVFTASHGMETNPGRPNQQAVQGALLCQDWPGFGTSGPDHYLAAKRRPRRRQCGQSWSRSSARSCFEAEHADGEQSVHGHLSAGLGTDAAGRDSAATFVAALAPAGFVAHPQGQRARRRQARRSSVGILDPARPTQRARTSVPFRDRLRLRDGRTPRRPGE